MTAVNDIIQIKSCGSLFNQQICNIFYYIVAIWTDNLTLDDVITDFQSAVLAPIALNQTDQYAVTEVELLNLTDTLEFAVQGSTIVGAISASEPMPSYVAFSVRLQRAKRNVRQGGKRIAGITESQVIDNGISVTTPARDQIEGACTSNLKDLPTPTDFRLDAVIVGRDPITHQPDISRFAKITEAFLSDIVSTQNTRKQALG